MWKATFYAFLLLLALNGKQLTPSRLAHAVTGHDSWERKGKSTSPITSPVSLGHSLLPYLPLPHSQVTVGFRRRTHKVRTATRS